MHFEDVSHSEMELCGLEIKIRQLLTFFAEFKTGQHIWLNKVPVHE